MKAILNLYGLLLAAVMVMGILVVAANASSAGGLYVASPQNLTVESGQYYMITAQAGNSILTYAPFARPTIYTYQWYNGTSGRLATMVGADSRSTWGIAGSPGVYTYYVEATNEQGASVGNFTTLTVTNDSTVSIIPASVKLDQGQGYRFKAAYAPGAGNASYVWNVTGFGPVSHCTYHDSTCLISTAGVAPGSYNVTLQVRDGSEPGYEQYPASAVSKVQVDPAPTIRTAVVNTSIRGNVIYSVQIVNGTGPFNVSIYTSNGTRVDSEKILATNQTVLMFFPTPVQTTAYYASASDLGVSAPYVFNSSANTIAVPAALGVAGSSTNSILIVIIVILVIVIIAVYMSGRGRGGSETLSDLSGSYGSAPEDGQDAFASGGEVYESESKPDEPEEEEQKQEGDSEDTADEEEEQPKRPARRKSGKSKKSEDED